MGAGLRDLDPVEILHVGIELNVIAERFLSVLAEHQLPCEVIER